MWGELLLRRHAYYFPAAPVLDFETARSIVVKSFGMFNCAAAAKRYAGRGTPAIACTKCRGSAACSDAAGLTTFVTTLCAVFGAACSTRLLS